MKIQGKIFMGALSLALIWNASAQPVDPLTNWQAVASQQIGLRGIAHLDGRFVAVGGGYPTNTAVSTDGLNWTSTSSGSLSNYEQLLAVDAAAGQFVAVGAPNGAIFNSTDGLQWTRRHSSPSLEFWAVAHGNGLFVAGGFSSLQAPLLTPVVALSPDGIQWEIIRLPQFNSSLRNIAYGNGIFVAVGYPTSLSSTNGRDWTAIPSLQAQGVAFGDGRFFATSGATAYTSTDGASWTNVPIVDTSTVISYYTVCHGNGVFLTGGWASGLGLLAAVGDGPVRNLRTTSFRRGFATINMGPIRDAIFVDRRYYLADQAGYIWRSGLVSPVTPPRFTRVTRDNGQTSLTLSTLAGFRYAVETADDLDSTDWQPLTPDAVPATAEELHFIDPQPDRPARFYRARTE